MPDNPDIDTFQLRCFLALAETGNFTRAAERLGRTQSAISQQIGKLEALMGTPLVLRAPRHASLTREGELLAGYARQMLQLKKELFAHVKESDIAGEIRFGTPEDFASVYLTDVLAAFTRSHPQTVLKVECDLTLTLMERLARGEFDLILIKQLSAEHEPHGTVVSSEHLEWVAAPHFFESIRDEEAPLPLVLSPAPCVYRKRAMDALDASGTRWRVTYTSPSFAGTVAAVRAGLGITVLPKRMIPEGLVALQSRRLRNLRQVRFVLLSRPDIGKSGAAFARFIAAQLR
jgi:DNA-binding transcriptional LysR family regulator